MSNITDIGYIEDISTDISDIFILGVIYNRHLGIMAAMTDLHLGWAAPPAYQRIYTRHLASNFMTRFKDKILKNLVCRAALASTERKFNKHMCKTRENSNFRKNGKIVISVKTRNFSRSRMTKWITPLESSCKI